MIKIEIILHLNFNEDEIAYKGQKLLDSLREAFAEAIVEEDFEKNCKLVKMEFIEEEVEPF